MQHTNMKSLLALIVLLSVILTPVAARCTNCTITTQTFTSSLGLLQTYYSAGDPLGVANSIVTTAIFAIHGTSRDGNVTYCYVDRGIIDSVNVTLVRSNYLIFAPEFPQVVDGYESKYIL